VQFYQHQLELFHNLCYVRSVTILPSLNRATPVCGDIWRYQRSSYSQTWGDALWIGGRRLSVRLSHVWP